MFHTPIRPNDVKRERSENGTGGVRLWRKTRNHPDRRAPGRNQNARHEAGRRNSDEAERQALRSAFTRAARRETLREAVLRWPMPC